MTLSLLQGSDERGIPDENGDEVIDQLNCETKGKGLYTSSAHCIYMEVICYLKFTRFWFCRISEDQPVPSELDAEVTDLSDNQEKDTSLEGQLKSQEPLDGVNEQTKVDDKENNNGLSAAQPTAIRCRKCHHLFAVYHLWSLILDPVDTRSFW